MIRTDVRAALGSIQAPTLVLHRSDDKFVPVGHGRYFAEAITRATYRELPGDAHLFHAGDTDELLAEIGEFLTGVREAPETDRMLATVMFTDIFGSTDPKVHQRPRHRNQLTRRPMEGQERGAPAGRRRC